MLLEMLFGVEIEQRMFVRQVSLAYSSMRYLTRYQAGSAATTTLEPASRCMLSTI